MRPIMTLGIVVLLLAVVGMAAPKPNAVSTNEEKVFVVDDSLKITGWVMRDTLVTNEPLIILMHQKGLTHESYQTFIDELTKFVAKDSLKRPMPTILNLDLRGHGKSVHRGKETLSYATMKNEEYLKIPHDVKQVVAQLVKDPSLGVDTTNVIVIGASIGANSAIMLTELLKDVKKVVMLSPGQNYHSLEPAAAMKAYTGDILIMAAKGDVYSKTSSETLYESNKAHCTLKWFGGTEHGTEIINGIKPAMNELIEWVMKK